MQPLPANTRSLSITAINALTKAIEKDFGLKVIMGAEIEYCAFPAKSSVDPNPLSVGYDAKNSADPPKYFENLHYVSAHYKEKPAHQYEVVLGHDKFDHPLQLAVAIDNVKNRISKLVSDKGLRVSFDPAINVKSADKFTTNALYLNFSLKDKRGDNLLASDPNLGRYLQHRCMEVMRETMAIQAPTKSSYERFNKPNSGFEPTRFDHLQGLRLRSTTLTSGEEIPQTQRIENRFPDSNADPYACIAVTLASVYYALSRKQDVEIVDRIPHVKKIFSSWVDLGPLPHDLPTAKEHWSNAVIIPDVLNTIPSVEANLGDRFRDAWLAQIGQGKSARTK